MLKIFISYRRDDTGPMTGRLSDRLCDLFPHFDIFLDVDSIDSGVDFKNALEQRLALSDIVLVIIGRRWLDVDATTKARRIDDPNDLVRFEVASALRRGLFVQPILVDGATMPTEADLPSDLRALVRHQAIALTTQNFRDDIQRLIKRIKELSPRRGEALLHRFVNTPVYVVLLSMMIISGMTLFTAMMLNISVFDAPIKLIRSNISDLQNAVITKELGYQFTLNWSLFILLSMPILIFLLHATMQEGNRLISEINLKKMYVYVDPDGQRIPRPAMELWSLIIKRTSTFILTIAALALSLGLFQWYQFSGQWYIHGFDMNSFLGASTGPDWQVSWALKSSLKESGLAITGFALWNYLFYSFGWAVTFSYYIFVFILANELQQVAQRIGHTKAGAIQVSLAETDTAGFGSLVAIQRYHGLFCAVVVFDMITMALRNTYLPPYCNEAVPASVPLAVIPAHCSSMLGLLQEVIYSGYSVIKDVVTGQSQDVSALFFTYVPSNNFTLGALYHILLIACFFFFISSKMRSIVETARANTLEVSANIGRPLIRELAINGQLTFVMIIAGAIATVFVNTLLIYAILLGVFWVVQLVRRPLEIAR